MTPEQKALLLASYQRLAPMSETAAQLFYSRLFELDPSLRSLFKSDFRDQSVKFMDMLRVAVAELEHPDKLDRALRELAVRHAGYGVREEHYDMVGESLLWAIEKALGRSAGPELKTAWYDFYEFIADTMKAAARTHRAGVADSADPEEPVARD